MRRLSLEISFAPGEVRGAGERVRTVFGGPLAGRIIPACFAGDTPDEATRLFSTEVLVSELFATRFTGLPITAELARRAEQGAVEAYCAIMAGLPRGPGGAIAGDAWLRFHFDSDTPRAHFVPLAVLSVQPSRFTLRFDANAAPLIPPPSRDEGGPIDQAWARAAEVSTEALGRALGELTERAQARLRLGTAELDPASARWIVERWGQVPGLSVDG